MTCPLPSAPEVPTNTGLGRLVDCPHPTLIRLHIVPSAPDLSKTIEQRDHAIREPLTITQDGYILAGHARWEVARTQGEMTLPCHQVDMTEEEGLAWLIRKHQRSHGINDFSRILLTLELEPWLRERARSNQRAGGQLKGSSNLTEAERIDVRIEIATIAGVSVGNVTKVKSLMQKATPEVLEALRNGEASIHCSSIWLKDPEKQFDQLTLHHSIRGITRTIRTLQRHQIPSAVRSGQLDLRRIASRLVEMSCSGNASVFVAAVQLPGEVLLLSTQLLKTLESQGELYS